MRTVSYTNLGDILERLMLATGKASLDSIFNFLNLLRSYFPQLKEEDETLLTLQASHSHLKSREIEMRGDDYTREIARLSNQTVRLIYTMRASYHQLNFDYSKDHSPLLKELEKLEEEGQKLAKQRGKNRTSKVWIWIGRVSLVAAIISALIGILSFIQDYPSNVPDSPIDSTEVVLAPNEVDRKEVKKTTNSSPSSDKPSLSDNSTVVKSQKPSNSVNNTEVGTQRNPGSEGVSEKYPLAVFTNPGEVQVYEENKFLGESNREGIRQIGLSLTKGKHELIFSKEGYKSKKIPLEIPRNAPLTVTLYPLQ